MRHEAFLIYVESLHPSFEKLMAMSPVKIEALPTELPMEGVYLLSEGENHLYVGRSEKLRQRMQQHSRPSAAHNQAVFAFKLAREATGRTEARATHRKARGRRSKRLRASGKHFPRQRLAFARWTCISSKRLTPCDRPCWRYTYTWLYRLNTTTLRHTEEFD